MSIRTLGSALAGVMAVAILVSGCEHGPDPGPTSPTPTPPQAAPPAPTPAAATLYRLSGVVLEVTSAGTLPVERVWVYCEPCGPPDGHLGQYTGADGAFTFDGVEGVAKGAIQLLLSKSGYELLNQPRQFANEYMGPLNVTVTGETRLEIRISRR